MSQGLNPIEKRAAFSLAGVYGLRMFGLFLIMPVLATYGQDLEGFSPLWVGIAIGAYGLTQALLQIPAGMASDRFGRKQVITLGLILFALGSVVAAVADSIYMVAVGRALQGGGAVASAVLALASDLTRDEQRPKVMAVIGSFIGVAFTLALVAGPILAQSLGLSGLFALTALLSIAALVVVHTLVPNAVQKAPSGDLVAVPQRLAALLKDPQLRRLDFSIMLLHLLITALFVALPLALLDAGLAADRHWTLYLPAMLLAFVSMIPIILYGVKRNTSRGPFLFAVALMGLACLVLALGIGSVWWLTVGVVLFFTGLNYLEAALPSLISRFSPPGDKGSAMGIYSTAQFGGAFLGGVLGGALFQAFGASTVFWLGFVAILFWFGYMWQMQNPRKTRSLTLEAPNADAAQANRLASSLSALPGVVEVILIPEQKAAYLKVEDSFDLEQARSLLTT
ncbi:MFS transporter [Ferrimonas marina]|uniref:Predicted arabinose efflux permease, MFS family n=1 Tax=Ferrimonas marina TaxID=299255 RepID=A0A1M5Y038_9GAMM|nr:MFS transporter [Ferrimonas marina]SHI05435.1 Predicted arabinose efflux permease, MFS family [Ferrimonas marina]